MKKDQKPPIASPRQHAQAQGFGRDANADIPIERLPIHERIPLQIRVSGLYERRVFLPIARVPRAVPLEPSSNQALADLSGPELATLPLWFTREELRLDVDGLYTQMTASGVVQRSLKTRAAWVASLTKSGTNQWTGEISYKDGDTSAIPHTQVTIQAVRSLILAERKATVTFSGGLARNRSVTFAYKSPYFHPVEFEYDTVDGATAVTEIETHAHPNHPATLADETLSIETVYRRAGFDVKLSGGNNVIPLGGAGADARWSDSEMHDAMQTHWSRFADRAQWSLWTFFASLHEMGTSLGGIMFDDIGPNHRQGTAIFSNSFIATAPAGDTAAVAWVARMRFWTAVHEMGHAFNLAHSWQKALGTAWIPLANDTEARSFMNYPYNVTGGQTAFFADFGFRFIDEELLFMRHAPERFVQMGNADWFDNHGFRQAETYAEPTFRLVARVNRAKAVFEFLEPICIELKLTNTSGQTQLVDEDILSGQHETTVILKRDGKPARQWAPYATHCSLPKAVAIEPGASVYDTLFVSAGLNGWDLAQPGNYTVQVAIRRGNEDIVSAALRLRIQPPAGFEEEDLAQDFFSEDVGRALAFDGTRVLESANDTLREAVERLPERRVAVHAKVALAAPGFRAFKELSYDRNEPKIRATKSGAAETKKVLESALTAKPEQAAETLGHIDYEYYVDRFSAFLAEQGDKKSAAKTQGAMHDVFAARGVLKSVLERIKRNQEAYRK